MNNNEQEEQRLREITEKRRARAEKKASKELTTISLQEESVATTTTRISTSSTHQNPGYAPRTLKYLSPTHHPIHAPNQQGRTRRTEQAPDALFPFFFFFWGGGILAQCLVRRSLFPGSDCLKWKDRGPTITQEILDYAPDVICLQEVDRVAEHSRVLSEAGYDMEYEIGGYETEGKQHGLMVCWKRTKLRQRGRSIVRLDEEETGSGRVGLSRTTRNVGLIVGLEWLAEDPDDDDGLVVVVGTAHLFWHPRYVYERARQTAFLVRALHAFQQTLQSPHTPLFLAGDFNDQPVGPSYRLLCGASMPQYQLDLLHESRLVHQSVDLLNNMSHHTYTTLEGDEDRVFKDVRPARAEDGLLTLPELRALVGPQKWRSLYGHWGHGMVGEEGNRFMDRRAEEDGAAEDDGSEGAGLFEPMWTNFTPLWRATLDYIWVLTPDSAESSSRCQVEVLALLPSHRTDAMLPGLPRLGIEPSDHVPLMALVQLLFPSSPLPSLD
ncbi:hypothetical protein VP01_2470g6 [Puccinia sorghi]|uniref:Endonuclease/exonuclease/phosphatase domain-containing protein n=1 Tax=Puccinia sorghi TaxID=27349 RepID=A0A0L6V660_9BASI|nr:hypothetical protein VP01_2470g6 [Puccinia sorghi]